MPTSPPPSDGPSGPADLPGGPGDASPGVLVTDPSGLDATVTEPTDTGPIGAPGDGGRPAEGAGGGGEGSGEGAAAAEDGAGGAGRTRRRAHWLVEAAIIVVVALLVAVLLRSFVVQTFYIPSGSMLPTLQIGDRILVDKLSYELHGVGRGDIVVFQRPPQEQCGGPPVNDLVKRVIGLPGDTISLSQDHHVYIDHQRLAEPYLAPYEQGVTTAGPAGVPYSLARPYVVPAGDYFVMGDNRAESCDSRYWGPIPKSLIVGKVMVRVWPLSHFHLF